ncbi:MAG: group III truncated hemoglobin [Gammaproteobacteria bacterium]
MPGEKPSTLRARSTHARIGHHRVAVVVADFYDRVQRHPQLSQPFATVRDWAAHTAKLTHFWWVALGGRPYQGYRYDIGLTHWRVGVDDSLVEAWLAVLRATLADHLPPPLAVEWHRRARRMAVAVRAAPDFYRRYAGGRRS